MSSWQQLEQFVKTTTRMLKGRRCEQVAFFVAALSSYGGFALTRKLIPDFNTDKWIAGLQVGLYAIGGIALMYGVVRAWRLVNPPELPPAKDRPSAIKGPMAFTEADGELFRKLGRENELRKLLGFVLDNQVLMVVVRGASGAGKTSLLRAGLKHIVGDEAVFHYWEAVPLEPDKGLLRAIQERWPEDVAKPATLGELINPSDALGRQSHVIVVDQFEQLRGNRKIFQLLRRIIRESRPPHRITWVIAFRREFGDHWLDFISPEWENGVPPPKDVPLRLFTVEQAREAIGQLINESDLKDSIEQSVIDNLVEAATVDGEVSPVDIGIGLLVLSELHERQSGQTITIRDYQFAGGAEGLLTQYISRYLEPYPSESKEAILKAMLALRDPEENRQRLATGLTIDELAMEAGTDARVLKLQLNRLADRDIRLLEIDTPTDGSQVRYRLPHERLIPALYRLTGKLLAEVDQAKLKFQNAFQAWKTNDKRSRYLLKGKELRLVQRNETQIPWGPDEQEKKSFLFRSKRHRQVVRTATVATVLSLICIGWFTILQFERFDGKRHLTENGYPAELYDFQHQLRNLEMTEPVNLEHFTWLSSDSIEELSLKAAPSSNSIAGLSSLSNCRSLKKLTLDIRNSQVSNLEPLEQLKGLRQLTLSLSDTQITDLRALEQLTELTQLSLDFRDSRVRDLRPLEKLSNLAQLSLDLRDSQVRELQSLARLTGLTQLSLFIGFSQVGNLQTLEQLKGLTQLTLDLRGNHVSDWKFLEQLKGLTEFSLVIQSGDLQPQYLQGVTQLVLYPGINKIRTLQPLAEMQDLTQLLLELSDSQVRGLQPLEQLKRLKHLSLYLRDCEVSDLQPLAHLNNLTQIHLGLYRSEVHDLRPLALLNNLTQLSLDLSGSQVLDLQLLAELNNLKQLSLDLRDSQVRDLQPLEQLPKLMRLSLKLRGDSVRDLNILHEQLKSLTQLTFDLSASQAGDLKPLEQLQGLTQLTLELTVGQVSDLKPLEQLKQVQELTVHLNGSAVSNLEPISGMTNLRTLSIENATRAQRMSLRAIPANLVELRF